MSNTSTRSLTAHERGCIRFVMVGNDLDPALVDAQLAAALTVIDDLPTAVDLIVASGPGRFQVADGPLPLLASHEAGRPVDSKEIMVWMEGGVVVMAELLSYSDEPPQDWPDPATLVMLDL